MAHGEADHGCAQGEPYRPGHHEQPAGKHHRRLAGGTPAHPGEMSTGRVPEPADDDVAVPRQRSADPPSSGVTEPVPASCRSDQPGWAGGHRHGPVRPRQRIGRRERPPRRWC
ncbi:hypothetical protein QTQ03_11585 [Micromonospora sp. WMMA1363]|uniref:hypothetical protein n=1 Tax=Micromonospora sp. WMMA1363 TaxID=3053985 RepID=UPI00259CE992|nr:hypothetical protein [Micromonospora sp. WMMA1363]MDM4720185.1 hypothetical protein [Micromonospora sp. WMMA1363]